MCENIEQALASAVGCGTNGVGQRCYERSPAELTADDPHRRLQFCHRLTCRLPAFHLVYRPACFPVPDAAHRSGDHQNDESYCPVRCCCAGLNAYHGRTHQNGLLHAARPAYPSCDPQSHLYRALQTALPCRAIPHARACRDDVLCVHPHAAHGALDVLLPNDFLPGADVVDGNPCQNGLPDACCSGVRHRLRGRGPAPLRQPGAAAFAGRH